MKPELEIRFADKNHEFPRVAELISMAQFHSVTAEDLHLEDKERTPGTIWHWWVAIQRSEIVAVAQAVHFGSQAAGRYQLALAVDRGWRGQGIGSALWEHVRTYLRGQGANRLVCELNDARESGLRFALRHGFEMQRQHIGSVLSLTGFDYGRFAQAETAVKLAGIRIVPFSSVENSLENRRRLYEVNRIAQIDNPGVLDPTFLSFESWCQVVLDAPWFDPNSQFVAVHGEALIGLSSVSHDLGNEIAKTKITGVRRAYRGRKIALALKLAVIRYVQARGAKQLVTENDVNNAPMLAINRKLGFVPEKGQGFYTLVYHLS